MNSQGYFLPFTPNGEATELQAIRVKRSLGLGPYSSVDPVAVLPRVPARVLSGDEFAFCSSETREIMLGSRGDGVSAIGLFQSPATNEWLIFLNPNHHLHRQRASLMEEIVHIVLDHPKTELSIGNKQRGAKVRSFNTPVEDEAYCVGAACMIPYRDLFFAIRDQHQPLGAIAERYNVSDEYVQYRIKRAGLSRLFAKHCR